MHRNEMMMKTISGKSMAALVLAMMIASLAEPAQAGSKRLMTQRKAQVVALRALTETVNREGLKIKSEGQIDDLIRCVFKSEAATKTKGAISGYTISEEEYDPQLDIARVVASIPLGKVGEMWGCQFSHPEKLIRRVGFATSTDSSNGPLLALRAAEIDAYCQLAEQMMGLEIESETHVQDYILKSDTIRIKVMALIYMAEVADFGWSEDGQDAWVNMVVNMDMIRSVFGDIPGAVGLSEIRVKGQGTSVDDSSTAQEI